MANKIDQFWEIFKAVSGDTSADVTDSANAIAKSDRTKVESYFSNIIDQSSFSTSDYNRLRKFLIDLYASFRTQSSISLKSSDPHSLTNSDLDELFRSMGYNYSSSLRGFDENPLEQKVQFFLDLVNLYKVKGTPQSLVDVLQYYGVTEVDIYEFFLKKDTPTSLIFDGKAVAGTTVSPSGIALPYYNLTSNDPHWLYTADQILHLDQTNKINLPSKSPYLGIQPSVDLEGAEMAIIERNVQDEYVYYNTHGVLPPATAEITYVGESVSLLELYISCVYMFNKLFDQGSTFPTSFLCYDGTSTDYVTIINEFKTLTESRFTTRDQIKSAYESYLTTFSRPVAENFLQVESSAGDLLTIVNPTLKNSLDTAGDPLDVMYSLLKDLALWVRSNIGFGFVNFGFILFGLQEFFKDLKPVIDFFKPYRARLLLLENLQIKNRLFNTIIVEDSFSTDVDFQFHDHLTGDGTPCCQTDDSTCTNSITVCQREFIGGSVPDYTWKDNWTLGESYVVNDAVASGYGNQYICIQANTATAGSKPGIGGAWTTYWQLMSMMVCTDTTATVSYYARDTYDCGSYFDIGAVTDIKNDKNDVLTIIEDSYYDHLRCPAADGTGFVVSELLSTEYDYPNIMSLIEGGNSAVVYLSTPMSNTNYSIGYSIRFNENLVILPDPVPSPTQYGAITVGKELSNFQIEFSSPIENSYYELDWYVYDSTSASSISIDTTGTSFNVPVSGVLPDYIVIGSISNVVDSNPSIYAFTIGEKTGSYFTVNLSGIPDSSNYVFEYYICQSGASGLNQIAFGSNNVSVTFTTPYSTSNYPVNFSIETESNSVYLATITNKTTTGFSVELSGLNDSTSAYLTWAIPTNGDGQLVGIDYYQSGGFRDFDSEGTFDCTHGFDLVQITVEDVINHLLQETGYDLLLEDGGRIIL